MILLLCLLSTAQADPAGTPPPPTPRAEEKLSLDGYFRTRGALYYNLDLDRGPTPSANAPIFPISPDDGETIASSDMRLRVDATLRIVSEVKIHARVDGLDNVILGSTPDGFPIDRSAPSIYSTTSQVPPTSGVNAFQDSIALKRVWGEADTPLGAFMVGRMGMPTWGLGMLANPGDSLDDDVDSDVDRIGFVTALAGHFWGVSYDWNAVGPTSATATGSAWGQNFNLTGVDDVHTLSGTVLRHLDDKAVERRKATGKPVFTWGTWVTWRTQAQDVPSHWDEGLAASDGQVSTDELIKRDFRTGGGDLYLCLESRRWEVAVEAALLQGSVGNASLLEGIALDKITMRQTGAMLRASVLPNELWKVGLEAGYASGDDAPGFGVSPPLTQVSTQPGDIDGPQFSAPGDTTVDNFRFSPNHHVDLILWRQIVGTFTDGIYLKPGFTFTPQERIDLSAHLVWSRAIFATSTPGGSYNLGNEIDLAADWRVWEGLRAQVQWGLLFPGAGFGNTALSLSPTPSQSLRGLVAFTF